MTLITNSNLFNKLPGPGHPLPPALVEFFDGLRQEGDPDVDPLVAATLGADGSDAFGRNSYNHLLDIADVLAQSPELVLRTDTAVARDLAAYPEGLRDYFDPIPAPPWVDEKKLAIASRLWQDDMIGILAVLYARSLPACYLMAKGIPALYDTAKLIDRKYIFQRIYETGLMLEGVLSPNGLRITHDIGHQLREHTEDHDQESDNDGHRYLWGSGYLTAKKVRFLHASMRYMLTNPGFRGGGTSISAPPGPKQDGLNFAESVRQAAQAYDSKALGLPVNQEDLAYTLLTFGYCIPQGLAAWGRKWTKDESEAFLHAWKVIGYVMGIREDLLTDRWPEAERLFHAIQKRQAAPSRQGKELTGTLMFFLCDYLPDYFKLDQGIAAGLIRSQMGPVYSEMLIDETHLRASESPLARIALVVGLAFVRNYYRVREVVYRVPVVHQVFRNIFDRAGLDLVQSWRDAYDRQPFEVEGNARTWRRRKGINEGMLKAQRAWRKKLFNTVAAGLLALFGAAAGLAAIPLFWLFGSPSMVQAAVWFTALTTLLGLTTLRYGVYAVGQQRQELVGGAKPDEQKPDYVVQPG